MNQFFRSRRRAALLTIAAVSLFAAGGLNRFASARTDTTSLADSMQKKIDHLKQNAAMNPPDQSPTVFSQDEINAYFASGRVKVPAGVESVTFDLAPGIVTARTHVDFDKLSENVRKDHPLLYIFSGTHDAVVMAHAEGSGGMAHVTIDSLELDGMRVPRRAMELFIERFVNPKYPSIRMDGEYHMPTRIDLALIGERTGTITQK